MKKIISLKEMIVVLIGVLVITLSTSVFAIDPGAYIGDGNNASNPGQAVTPSDYAGASKIPEDPNYVQPQQQTATPDNTPDNNVPANNTNTNNENKAKTYNTNTTDLPQAGIEDYNVGILLVICIASAIIAYKKINDYKNV